MKPFIGLTPLYDDDKKSYWILPGYMEEIEHAGGIPIMLPLTADRDMLENILCRIDGLVLTGGHDVSMGKRQRISAEGSARSGMKWSWP